MTMKKLILTISIVLGINIAAQAESAVGARLANLAELSYQTDAFGNRTEIDLGWSFRDKRVGAAGIYQFILPIVDRLNWYYGVGAGIQIDDELYIGALGNLGIEYNIKEAPFQISLDWRPGLGLIPETKFHGINFGFGIRYKF